MGKFQHIELLYGLVVVPLLILLFLYVINRKREIIKKLGDPKLISQLTRNYSPLNFAIKFFLGLFAITAVILGAANLQTRGVMEDVQRKGIDVVIALDVSKSMLAEDIKPNRLEIAKQVVYKLMNELQNDRIAIVLFAGRAYLQMPLTSDHGAAHMYIQNAGPEIVPTQGTVFSEALRMANSAFNSNERKFKSIVLISDGEDHDAESITVAQQLAANGVMINTIGIGSAEGAPILDRATNEYKKDEQGATIISKLNESQLQQLAQITNGAYTRLNETNAAVTAIMTQLGTIERTALEDNAFKNYKSLFQWFLGASLLFLLLEFFFPERKWRITE